MTDQHSQQDISADTSDLSRKGDFSALMQILSGCVISPQYAVPEKLVSGLVLTDLGTRIAEELRSKHRRTRPAEAKLAVALSMGIGDRMLLDLQRSDLEAMRSAITSEIRGMRILFPNAYSKGMASTLFATNENNPHVSITESIKLCRSEGPGVYQVGRFVVGPWGCIESAAFRALTPEREVLGYLCEEHWCTRVHPFYLQTAENAPINRARQNLNAILEPYYSSAPRAGLREFRLHTSMQLGENPLVDSELLFNWVGDALSDEERTRLAEIVLRRLLSDNPGYRTTIAAVSGRILADPADFCSALTFSETMQLLHLQSDELIITSIDRAVESKVISAEPDLRRTARVERWPNRSMTAELGTKGLRFRISEGADNVILGNVLSRVYAQSSEDLAFALDRPSTETLDSLVSLAFQTMEVEEVADNCLINNRHAAQAACRLLYISPEGSRAQIADKLKWRLGISDERSASGVLPIIQMIEKYLTEPPERDVNDKRGELSNIYVETETELLLALRFSSWALTEDHYTQRSPFSLRIGQLPPATKYLLDREGNEILGNATLQPLASSFARLAKALEKDAPTARDPDSLPIPAITSGRPFAFRHLRMYDDLTPESQQEVLEKLRAASRSFGDGDVIDVRNTGPGHGNNSFPEDDQIRVALTKIRRGLEALAEGGLTPIIYERVGTSRGLRGQTEAKYHGWKHEVALRTPYWPVAPGLPGLQSHLVIIPSAVGPGWGQLRFRLPGGDRGGPQWEGWPPRRTPERSAEWQTRSDAAVPGEVPDTLPA